MHFPIWTYKLFTMLEPVSFIVRNFKHLPVYAIVFYAVMFFGIVIAIKFKVGYPNLPTRFMVGMCACVEMLI